MVLSCWRGLPRRDAAEFRRAEKTKLRNITRNLKECVSVVEALEVLAIRVLGFTALMYELGKALFHSR